ncbi:cation:proton antiporter [Streptomyces sp. 7-21]|uniref:cation:proton antiporter domain-containing protein n=1 Tax=Streptomyces sp. 7-21 TaxID=2802283 RepID=UPI00191F90C6|nr:cation:proton antiporter [Streptomyces sp. 7-21]MBL1068714.1 cation:proton antiporter [Streptomyces sp. 7-21]
MAAGPGDLPLEAVVMADIALVLMAVTAVVRLTGRLRQPPVIAEIVTGLLLGPSVLGLLPGELPDRLFPQDARPLLSAVAQFGLLLFMFLAGWEMDLTRLRGRRGAVTGLAALAMGVPFAAGLAAAALLYGRHAGGGTSATVFALYLATAFSITAFPVLARVITDSRLTGTRVGTVAMACAAAGDVLAWCALVLVVALSEATGPGRFLAVLGLTAAYGLVMLIAVRPALRALMRRAHTRAYSGSLLTVIASGVLLSAYATSWIGVHAIFGAFAFGLAMPRGLPEAHRRGAHRQVAAPLQRVAALLLPVFFIVTGLSVDVGALGWSGAVALALVLVTAVAGKLAGAVLPARLTGMTWREATGFGVLMNTRGLTEIVILDIGRQLHVISAEMFTMMVVMALVTTAMAGPVLHALGLTPPPRAPDPPVPAPAAAVAAARESTP